MNVLSLFDGMSCGRQALERANIKVDKYYASEIDKYAIKVTQYNYPDTIQIGSVTEVDVSNLDPIDLLIGGSPCQSFSFAGRRNGMTTTCNEEIYTLDRYLELKSDGFQFEGESYLFWEYMRILTDIRKCNPDVLFLLENVEMGNKWERILSEAIGIFGVHINSALVSAQNRKRIYWTNIRVREEGLFGELHSDIPQPEDRGILLKDILEDEVDEKYYLSEKMLDYFDSNSKLQKEKGNGLRFSSFDDFNTKSKTITTKEGGRMESNFLCVAMRGRGENNEQQLEPQLSGKTNSLTSVQKDNLVMQLKQINNRVDDVSFSGDGIRPFRNDTKKSGIQELGTIGMGNTKSVCVTSAHPPKLFIPEATLKGYVEIEPGECFDAENINSKTRRGRKMVDKSNCLMAKETEFMRYEYFEPNESINQTGLVLAGNMRGGRWENIHESSRRVYDPKGKAPTVSTMQGGNQHPKTTTNARIRRLTPTECERLQTVKDNYTACVSDTQRYKMLGNGWNVETVAHIFKQINYEESNSNTSSLS